MELWDRDYIDLDGPGYLVVDKEGFGEFRFGAVSGDIDYRIEKRGDFEELAFSWRGQDDMDEASGRGWARLAEGRLEGRLYFHDGDDSGFVAEPMKQKKRKATIKIKIPVPTSSRGWLKEMMEACLDTLQVVSSGRIAGKAYDQNSFYRVVAAACLKNRGLEPKGKYLDIAAEAARESYPASLETGANSLKEPHLAFVFCYLTAHFGLELIDDVTINSVLEYMGSAWETLLDEPDEDL